MSMIRKLCAEGVEQDTERGMERIREYGELEVAKTMLAENMDIPTIARCTGFAIGEIEKLKIDKAAV